ncbi:ras protein Rap 2a [Echinococcus multilocularis]|uniref:Ras protein Rap 2a n=1 Tax=Echinococcus multilocularis TaxID=6211 RepID=A0A087W1Y0_ECHMU|nr:ras protein Rap 2a [Echinococcus multilocularis]
MDSRRRFTVVVLGSGGVGKSALVVKFVCGKFVDKYDPTIEDFYQKEVSFAGLPKVLRILDTAGTSQFSSLHDLYIKNGDGFLIVYNLVNRQSFNDIRNMRENILRVKGLPSSGFVPLVLVGTKSDLFNETDDKSYILRDPINLANEWLCPHIETSARNNVGVEAVFLELLSQMMKSPPQRKKVCSLL